MSNLYLDVDGNLLGFDMTYKDVEFRNFSGLRSKNYPSPNSKMVTFRIQDDNFAQVLMDNHWPLRLKTPNPEYTHDPDAKPYYVLDVKIQFRNRYNEFVINPPVISFTSGATITEFKKERAEELCTASGNGPDGTLSEMDKARFEKFNVKIRLAQRPATKYGYSAYLQRFDGFFRPDPMDEARNGWANQGA